MCSRRNSIRHNTTRTVNNKHLSITQITHLPIPDTEKEEIKIILKCIIKLNVRVTKNLEM